MQSKISVNDFEVYVFKLKNGEVGIGKLNREKEVMEKCCAVRVIGSPDGRINIQVVPFFFPLSEELPEILLEHILCMVKVKEDIAKEYIRQVSDIVVASPIDLNNIQSNKILKVEQ